MRLGCRIGEVTPGTYPGRPKRINVETPMELKTSGFRRGAFLLVIFLTIVPGYGAGRAAEMMAAGDLAWQKTVQAAKREGQITIYATDVYEQVFRQFQRKYPEINVMTVTGAGVVLSNRILSERRAAKYLGDIYIGGSVTGYTLFQAKALDPIKPALILPEVVEESKWWKRKHHYVDPPGEYIIAFNGIVQAYFAYNTKIVNPKEFSSYWNFLNPRWKGKIVVNDPMLPGVTGALRFLYYNPDLGAEYLRRFLSEMELTPIRDLRQFVDWLASGKFAISAFGSADRAGLMMAKAQGLSVDWFEPTDFKEGTPAIFASNGNVALIDGAPHPNAAKLAINWLLSKEGQITYQAFQPGADSLRVDIPKDKVPSHTRRKAGADYELMDRPERMDLGPIYKVVEQVWKKR